MNNPHHVARPASERVLLFIVVVLAVLGIYVALDRERIGRWYAGDLIAQEKLPLETRIGALEAELSVVRDEIDALDPRVPEERLEEVFGRPPSPDAITAPDADPCAELERRVHVFFLYLANRDYVRILKLDSSLEDRLADTLKRVLGQPPTVERETDSLTSIFNNTVHFFRALGKEDTLLIRDILKNEGDVIEPAFDLFSEVFEQGDRCPDLGSRFGMPLDGAYEYAAYFLGTLGGRSYLLRRASPVRQLTMLHAIRILNKANARNLNAHGIDIRPPLDTLVDDLEASYRLSGRTRYLRELRDMRKHYAILYGG